jgi:hypothetical protein
MLYHVINIEMLNNEKIPDISELYAYIIWNIFTGARKRT